MKALKILIVDDEPLAHKVLKNYIEKIDFLEVIGYCFDGVSTINFLNEHHVDAILLDIQMPDLTGMELLEVIDKKGAKVIFTTAYTEYALDSFNHDHVIDYLHKPIRLSRFIKSMERLKRIITLEEQNIEEIELKQKVDITQDYVYIKDGHSQRKINFSNLIYIQSYGNYVKYFVKNGGMFLNRQTISNVEITLPSSLFIRIHKSYIVNFKEIQEVVGNQVKLGNFTLPIGKSYKEYFKNSITGDKNL